VIDVPRAEAAVRELLAAVGEDPDREGLRDTPARVARSYAEIFSGLDRSPSDVLTTMFEIGHDELVLEVPDAELARIRDALPGLMGSAGALSVPLLVEVGCGKNWDEAH
jgi:GTP cyclohydrolase I